MFEGFKLKAATLSHVCSSLQAAISRGVWDLGRVLFVCRNANDEFSLTIDLHVAKQSVTTGEALLFRHLAPGIENEPKPSANLL